MSAKSSPGRGAVEAKGWIGAHKWLLLRRFSQFFILALFLAGPMAGVWIVKGNLTSSLTLGVLPLSDPFVLLQSFLAGHALATTAVVGAVIVLVFYAFVGGRAYCTFVCPVNVVTDAARWLAERLDLPRGWRPARQTRLWLLGGAMAAAAATGVMAWEWLNPVTLVHRGLVYGMGSAWVLLGALFVFDLVVSRRGWCGRLCPMGAFYGLVGAVSVMRISAKRRADCNDCMDCFAVCPEPHVIAPALHGAKTGAGPVILSGDCTNCARCVDVCAKDVFTFDVRLHNAPPEPSRARDTGDGKISPNRCAA